MAANSFGRPRLACSGLCSRCRGLCAKSALRTQRGAPLLAEGSPPGDYSRARGKGVYVWRLFSLNRVLFYFFCHHTFYFCASLVCAAAFVSLLLPWFFYFIFNFLLLLCSLGILLHCLILYLGGICKLIMKWKCINSPGLPFSVRRKNGWRGKKWEQEAVFGTPFNLNAYNEIVIHSGFGWWMWMIVAPCV